LFYFSPTITISWKYAGHCEIFRKLSGWIGVT
jgi:hypothetical protein